MHNLRYMTFDMTQAVLVVGAGIAVIVALQVFQRLASRHVREHTQRALDAVTKRDRDVT